MRKEVRLGLGIGGVLLAVIIVAAVVRSHSRHNAQQANKGVDKPAPDPTPPDVSTDTGTTPPEAPAAPPAPVKPPDVDALGDPAPVRPVDWDTYLANGVKGGLMATQGGVTSVTPPAPGHGVREPRGGGDPFTPAGGHSASPGFTPGSMTGDAVLPGGSPPAAPKPPAAAARTHTIAQGETFSSIARTVYGDKKYYLLIAKANPNVVPERLRPGTTINLPELPAADRASRAEGGEHHARAGGAPAAGDPKREYAVQAGDSLYRISTKLYGNSKKIDAIYDLNKDRIGPDRERLKLGMVLKLPEPPSVASR